jgi:hypothetical protein
MMRTYAKTDETRDDHSGNSFPREKRCRVTFKPNLQMDYLLPSPESPRESEARRDFIVTERNQRTEYVRSGPSVLLDSLSHST